MRVAYYSPLPPERSGIADYSALLVPALARKVDLRIARRRRRPGRGVDISLYHVGNNPEAHGWIVEALCEQPGLVVLHDFVLHHLVSGLTLGRGPFTVIQGGARSAPLFCRGARSIPNDLYYRATPLVNVLHCRFDGIAFIIRVAIKCKEHMPV